MFFTLDNDLRLLHSSQHLGIDFLVEGGLLHFQLSFGVGHFCVGEELDVHHLLLALGFLREDSGDRGHWEQQYGLAPRRPPAFRKQGL